MTQNQSNRTAPANTPESHPLCPVCGLPMWLVHVIGTKPPAPTVYECQACERKKVIPPAAMNPASKPRQLTACLGDSGTQVIHRGIRTGLMQANAKFPLKHLARFLLIALYTGTRSGAVLTASPYPGEGRSYVDLERGIFYRLAEGARETNKRQPPVPIPPRLLAHMRRWVDRDMVGPLFVERQGKPIQSVKTAFESATRLAGLEGKVVPHTLRHREEHLVKSMHDDSREFMNTAP